MSYNSNLKTPRVYFANARKNKALTHFPLSYGDLKAIIDDLQFMIDAPLGSVQGGITADTGSAQGDGLITNPVNYVTTVGTAGDALTLPNWPIGATITVANDGANSLDVFPPTGGDINGAGANVAQAVAAGETRVFIKMTATVWKSGILAA